MTEKQKNLFEDLGKPTLRGVRKCPKCGTYNGTRGLSCKNKACKLIFKVVKEKIKTSSATDAVKINNNSNLQIYSVKFQDSSDDLRCFVHLPIIEGIEALQDASEITVIKRSAAICYAKSCRKPLDDMCTITLNLNPCAHADLVVNCVAHAEPLNLKKIILSVLPISHEVQEEIWCLASKSDEYLIQRVTKSTFAIRCNPDDQHPLGFLHFCVFEPGKNSRKYRILCECQSEITKPFVPKEKNICIHFYICICAFASEARLLEEFKPLVQSVLSLKSSGISTGPIGMSENKAELKTLRDIFLDGDGLSPCPPKRKKNESKYAGTLYLLQENTSKSSRSQKKLNSNANKKQTLVPNDMLECISFEQWLASVTERINQTMHYQFTGSPEPLVFHVPQKFFDVLQQRISAGSKKKRLPNTVVAFSRKDSLPLGIFSKYTWHITNILHVKQIFDTPIMPLEITRSFIENRDGTFSPCEPPLQNEKDDVTENFRKKNNLLIKPFELKTFLKVGNMTLDQKLPTPFIVEWIPDVLPKTHVGELRIKFEYGHQRNGIIENPFSTHVQSQPKNTCI